MLTAAPFVTRSQSATAVDGETFHIISSIAMAALIMAFIISLTRKILDQRIKNKIIEKNIPEPLGIHSVAIMAFCLAGSFLVYFLLGRGGINRVL